MPGWTLDSQDGFTIYGLLDQPAAGPGDKAILLVHGMTGNPKEAQHDAAARYFSALGYDVIRPYLYCMNNDRKVCRKFQDVTIAIHAMDIDTVTAHFAPQYKTLYAAGHSYGGPSILTADTAPFKAICLWDPSFKQKVGLSNSFTRDEKTGQYVISWDHKVVAGQAFLDENAALDRAHCITLAKNCKAPLRVIWAADGDYIAQGESYHSFAKTQSDVKIVQGTNHCFVEPGTTEPLLDYTREWFERFSS